MRGRRWPCGSAASVAGRPEAETTLKHTPARLASLPVGGRTPKHAAPRRARSLRPGRRVLTLAGLPLLALAGVAGAWLSTSEEDPPVGTGAGAVEPAEESATSVRPASTPPTTATTATTAGRDAVLGNGQSVTLAFAGDTNFEDVVATRLAADPASVFGPMIPALSAADLTVVNMETAIGTGGTPAPKEFVFQAPPVALEAFRAAGVDVVSAANNHGMDFGVASLEETLAAEADLGFPVIGIGRDESEAYAPFFAEVRGQRIAVIAATQVLDDSMIDLWTADADSPGLASAKRVDRLVAEVRAARAAADTVVVFLHWGIERQTCPSEAQTALATELAAAGADVIVGGHAHRLQGGGRLGDAVVHYGLGNFAFYAGNPEGARTGVFRVTVTGRRVDGYEWIPGTIVDRQPRPLDGAAAEEAIEYWESLRSCTNLTD